MVYSEISLPLGVLIGYTKITMEDKKKTEIEEKTDTLDRDKSAYIRMLLAQLPKRHDIFCSGTTFNLRNPFVVLGVMGEVLFEMERELRQLERLSNYCKKQVIEPTELNA